jgi:LCP family protein required for cell wall assembly
MDGGRAPAAQRDPGADERTRQRRRKAPLAAFLSFLFPGGGQLFNHQPRLALFFALPVAALIIALALTAFVIGSDLLPILLDSRAIIGLLILDVVVLVWRAASMLQAHRRRARFRPGRVGTQVTAVLVLAALAMHAVPAAYGLKVLETLDAITAGRGDSGELHDSIPIFTGPSAAPLPVPEELPDEDANGRTNILLIGVDSGAGRDHALTDTMLVVSLRDGGDPAMISIPRDLVNAPLPGGEAYPAKLNSLLQTANADPVSYPRGAVATLKATVSNLLGVPIHYLAAVDMAGFQHVIDAIGGVSVVVETAVADPHHRLYLDVGTTFMDGELALTFVRSRYGAGNNDFVRAGRQQQVIAAVQDKLSTANLVVALPELLDAVQDTIATDVPEERIAALAALLQRADFTDVERVVIQPPEYVTPATGEGGAYVLLPDLGAIKDLGERLMGD